MTPLLPIHFDDEVANPCSAAQVLYLPPPSPPAHRCCCCCCCRRAPLSTRRRRCCCSSCSPSVRSRRRKKRSLSLPLSLSPTLSPSLPKTDGRHFRRSRCSTILDKKRPSWTCLSADAEDRETKFRSVSVSAFFLGAFKSLLTRASAEKKISTNFYFFSHVDV